MESIRLGVERPAATSSRDRFYILCDYGSGEIDENAPLNPQPQPFWPHGDGGTRHLETSHIGRAHVDLVEPDGHLHGRHLSDHHLQPAGIIEFVTPPFYFGRIQFAIKSLRGEENTASESKSFDVIANSAPRAVYRVLAAHVSSGVLSLQFEASPDLI